MFLREIHRSRTEITGVHPQSPWVFTIQGVETIANPATCIEKGELLIGRLCDGVGELNEFVFDVVAVLVEIGLVRLVEEVPVPLRILLVLLVHDVGDLSLL